MRAASDKDITRKAAVPGDSGNQITNIFVVLGMALCTYNLRRTAHGDLKFKASLAYVAVPVSKKKKILSFR